MALRNLSKVLAILILSLTAASPTYAAPGEITPNTESTVQYTVPGLIRRGKTQVKAIVEEGLLSHDRVSFKGKSYTEEEWCYFFVRNLLIGPHSCGIKSVKFSAVSPVNSLLKIFVYGDVKVYVSGETLVIICKSIYDTSKLNMFDLRSKVIENLFSDVDDATIEKMTNVDDDNIEEMIK